MAWETERRNGHENFMVEAGASVGWGLLHAGKFFCIGSSYQCQNIDPWEVLPTFQKSNERVGLKAINSQYLKK